MVEYIDQVPIFTNDKGEPYRLFIHKCPEREKVAEMIEVSDHNLQVKVCVVCVILINVKREHNILIAGKACIRSY
jgi:hypothetical protein